MAKRGILLYTRVALTKARLISLGDLSLMDREKLEKIIPKENDSYDKKETKI